MRKKFASLSPGVESPRRGASPTPMRKEKGEKEKEGSNLSQRDAPRIIPQRRQERTKSATLRTAASKERRSEGKRLRVVVGKTRGWTALILALSLVERAWRRNGVGQKKKKWRKRGGGGSRGRGSLIGFLPFSERRIRRVVYQPGLKKKSGHR